MKQCRVIIIMTIILFCECTSKSHYYSEISFVPEIFPYTDTIYSKHNNQKSFYDFGKSENKKIIFYTNGDCGTCFHQIIQWQEFMRRHSKQINNVDYAIVIQTEIFARLEYNLEKVDNLIPIYIDTTKCFSIYNNISTLNPQILVLDEHNIVKYYSENKFEKIKILKALK